MSTTILVHLLMSVRSWQVGREVATELKECVPDMFDLINRSWTTTPYTEVPGLYLAGSDAFLPSVTGAMYGGCLGASAVLGYGGTLRLGHALLSHLARRLREENPKLSSPESYVLAVKKFMQ